MPYCQTQPPIAVMTHNRLNLTRATMESIERTIHGEITVYDDGSERDTLEYLGTLCDRFGYRLVNSSEKSRGADWNTYYCCRHMARCTESFFLTSNDFVYHHNCFVDATSLLKGNVKAGIVGLFNSRYHQRSVSVMGQYRRQSTVSGPVLISSAMWHSAENDISVANCDWSMAEQCLRSGWEVLCFEKSRGQHLGILKGVHATRDDVAFCFIGEDGEFDHIYSCKTGRERIARYCYRCCSYQNELSLFDDGSATFLNTPANWSICDGRLFIYDSYWQHVFYSNSLHHTDHMNGFVSPVGAELIKLPATLTPIT